MQQTNGGDRKAESSQPKRREYSGSLGWVVKIIATIVPLYCTFYVLNISGIFFKVTFYASSFRAVFLALVLTLLFLIIPANENASRRRLPWYDLILILAAWIPTVYEFFIYPEAIEGLKLGATVLEQILFIMLTLVLIEAIRRTIGFALVFIILFFLLYSYFAHRFPGLWGGPELSLEQLTEYMYLYDSGIFGFVLGLPATIIIFFLLFGRTLMRGGGTDLFMKSAFAIAGRFRGGPAKVAIFSSATLAMVSGSVSANVGTTGAITIPLMKRLGYKDYFAGAVEAVSSTGGVITPPVMGAVAFIMAEATGEGYLAVCKAAIVPAFLYFLALYVQLDFRAAKLGLGGMPVGSLPSLKGILKKGWYLLLPVLVLVMLLIKEIRVQDAVLYSIGTMIILSWLRKEIRIGPKGIFGILAESTHDVMVIVPTMAAAGIISGAVAVTGIGVNLGVLIKQIAAGNLWLLAAITLVIIYASGMSVGEVVLYIIMSIILVPAFVAIGVPVLAAHMFIFYVCISMFITPPNCPAVFVACSIAGSGIWRTGFQAMRLGFVAFLIPFFILIDPALILTGSPGVIAMAVPTAIAGVLFLSAGIEGYLMTVATWWQRILFIFGGLGLFIPGMVTNLAGLAILVIPTISQIIAFKRAKTKKSQIVPEVTGYQA